MQGLDVGETLGLADRVPEVDQLLTAPSVDERRDVLDLLLLPVVILAVLDQLVQDTERLGRRELLSPLIVDVPVQDVVRRDHPLVALDELGVGDASLHAHESGGQGVDPLGTGAGQLRGHQAHVPERLIQAVPGSRSGDHRAGLHAAGVDPQVLGVVADEVHRHRVDAGRDRPVDPVVDRGLEIDRPEPPQQCRVHLVDVVLRAVVNSSEDPRLGVELVGVAVLVVTQLSVQDQLEEALLHTRQRAVQLVEHQDHRLTAGAHEPGGHAEGHHARLFHSLDVGVTTHIALTHR